jgi:hypothetical protein
MPDLISGIISVIKLPTPAGLLAVKTLHFNDARRYGVAIWRLQDQGVRWGHAQRRR